jgi:hypothetical protein
MTAGQSTQDDENSWPVTSGHGQHGLPARHSRPEVGGHLGYFGFVPNVIFKGGESSKPKSVPRRAFLQSSAIVGSLAVLHSSGKFLEAANTEYTLQEVIDLIIRKCVDQPFPKTVDTVKTGDPAQNLRGVATAFLATRAVIEKAVQLKASLIILGHEASEEPGMKYLAAWLEPLLPGIAIHHIPAGSPFAWV